MNPARGIVLKLFAVILFMTMTSLIKATADAAPPGEQIFFRSFFALPVVIGYLIVTGDLRSGLKAVSRTDHLIRGLVGVFAMSLAFFAIGHLSLPEVVAIFFAMPIFMTIFAALFLKERIRAYRIGAVLLGITGVGLITWPRFAAAESTSDLAALAAGAALLAAIAAALAQVWVARMTKRETTTAITFWFAILCTTLSALTAPFGWSMPSAVDFAFLVMAGVLGGWAQILMTTAYRYAEASVVAPFDYAQIVFALIIGYFIFNETPTPIMLIGAALTIAAGLIIIWRERVRASPSPERVRPYV
ncbi:MAG: DMT family transporter [Pseudomonadota bacterium]